jgi:selenocysteine-specific elongation factor
MPGSPQLVVGTAGHIDHGKSRLVWMLTGVDPDRLPEEKVRGMTIDLGFGYARIDECDIWFVDVPGHERFIRNMVAGATGVDLALLVVAADDSVMPQTGEHAELLAWLGVERCIVAVTKIDLVDDAWADQVEQEARELLASVGIQPLAAVRTSAETGRGFDELRRILATHARHGGREAQRGGPRWFRLPIDRSFSVAGRGTVVTGSVAHGAVSSGDELELLPAGRRVRVRDIQSHNEQRTAAAGRMRLAINLANVAVDEVGRGCELVTPGYLEPTRRFDARIVSLRMPGRARRQALRVRLHSATSEVLATVRFLDPLGDTTVRHAFAQVHAERPIVLTWGQRFILRDESATRSLGGGRVLRPIARAWSARRPPDAGGLARLAGDDVRGRLEELIRGDDLAGADAKRLAGRAALGDANEAAELCAALTTAGRIARFEIAGSPLWIHLDVLRTLATQVDARLKRYLDANPRLPGVAKTEWPAWLPRTCPQRLRAPLAQWLIDRGHVALADGYVVSRGRAASMSPEDQRLYESMLAEFEAAAFQPPALEALKCCSPGVARRLAELIKLGVARGRLVRIADGMWLHERRWRELASLVVDAIRQRGPLSVSDIRTLLHSTRKYVVPLVEALDAAGITRRAGDLRALGGKARPESGAASSDA